MAGAATGRGRFDSSVDTETVEPDWSDESVKPSEDLVRGDQRDIFSVGGLPSTVDHRRPWVHETYG